VADQRAAQHTGPAALTAPMLPTAQSSVVCWLLRVHYVALL
jgi:hypothetical protein